MAHSDERCAYHMIFHGLQYTVPSTVIAILNILSAILILHISDNLEYSRLSPRLSPICLFPSISPLSQNYLEHSRLSLTWSISDPQFLKLCYHGDILGSPKDVPELQWYNLIGQVSEYVLLSIDI